MARVDVYLTTSRVKGPATARFDDLRTEPDIHQTLPDRER